jgi:anti-sigma factor RsiW
VMEHREIRERLNDYAENALSERDRRTVDAHLESCPDCAEELAALRRLLDAASRLPRTLEPERDLWPSVRSEIAPAGAPRRGPVWTRFVFRWQPLPRRRR